MRIVAEGQAIRVREANREDAAAVAAILCEAFPSLYLSTFGLRDPARLVPMLTRLYEAGHLPLDETLVAVREKQVVGVAILNTGKPLAGGSFGSYVGILRGALPFFPAVRAIFGGLMTERFLDTRIPRAPDLLYLEALAVAETQRGNGVGSLLLNATEDAARAQGRKRLALHVLVRNAGARRLYARHGFEPAPLSTSRALFNRALRPLLSRRNEENGWEALLQIKRLG